MTPRIHRFSSFSGGKRKTARTYCAQAVGESFPYSLVVFSTFPPVVWGKNNDLISYKIIADHPFLVKRGSLWLCLAFSTFYGAIF
ncbi:MAG TPA: hypothetical protein DDW93_03005 [Firmicutes bacterium]|nr:hypothetical protein [Bacillota bacterium]